MGSLFTYEISIYKLDESQRFSCINTESFGFTKVKQDCLVACKVSSQKKIHYENRSLK